MTRRYLPLFLVAAATAAIVLTPDDQVRPTPRAIDHQPTVPLGDSAHADLTTPDPGAAVFPLAAQAAFRSDAQGKPFRMNGPDEGRHSHAISDPIPVEETGRRSWPNVVRIGEPLDADAPLTESADALESMPTQIGRITDANETEVWYLPPTSTEVIEIGSQLDADSPWPNQNQEREPVDIGPPIETEGLGTLL